MSVYLPNYLSVYLSLYLKCSKVACHKFQRTARQVSKATIHARAQRKQHVTSHTKPHAEPTRKAPRLSPPAKAGRRLRTPKRTNACRRRPFPTKGTPLLQYAQNPNESVPRSQKQLQGLGASRPRVATWQPITSGLQHRSLSKLPQHFPKQKTQALTWPGQKLPAGPRAKGLDGVQHHLGLAVRI